MNMQEFAALKVGDTVEVLSAGGQSRGEVTETTDSGVRVKWGPKSYRGSVTFFYSVNSTAWMHWGKVDVEMDDNAGSDAAPDVPGGAEGTACAAHVVADQATRVAPRAEPRPQAQRRARLGGNLRPPHLPNTLFPTLRVT